MGGREGGRQECESAPSNRRSRDALVLLLNDLQNGG